MQMFKAAVFAVAAAALVGCGGAGAKLGGGKEGAAQAVYQASTAASRYGSPLGGGIDFGISTEIAGSKGGKAKVTLGILATAGSAGTKISIEYFDFSEDGKTRYNGSLEVVQAVEAGAGSASVLQSIKGNLQLSGDIEDSLEVEITQSVAASSGSASITMSGRIKTSTEEFTYDNDVLNFVAGASLPAAPPNN